MPNNTEQNNIEQSNIEQNSAEKNNTKQNKINLEEIKFSLMEQDDLIKVSEIEKESFTTPWTLENFSSALEKDYCHFITAKTKENELVGYCGLYQSYEEADITNVAVNSKFRNLGVGEAMLRFLIETGERRGIKDFTLEVRRTNSSAIRLYEKCGFESVGYRKNFYRNPQEDACIMWRYQDKQ